MNRFCLHQICINRKQALIYTFALSFFAPVSITGSVSTSKNQIVVETFSPGTDKEKRVPKGWRSTRSDMSTFTFGKEDDNYFETITSIGTCNTIGKKYSYSAKEFPYLIWKWRVHKLPIGATELRRDKNDSGAGFYVIFKGHFKLNPIIKYVWSTSLPTNTTTRSPYNSNTKIIVLESGTQKIGQWVTESVNVYEDYKRLFGSTPPKIEGFGLLTDSDNTKSSATADYDDIIICQELPTLSSN